jgi:tetratricopeptide (TPR) repeat protein
MTTGCPAFSGATSAVISAAVLHEQPRPPRQIRRDLSVRLEEIIAKAIEKDRNLRYQHAADLRADLRRALRDTGSAQTVAAAPARPRLRRTLRWLAPSAVVAGAVAVAIAVPYFRSHRPAGLTDKDTIVLADFTNTTGDSVFDDTLRQGLTVQLEQSPFLSLVSDERVRTALQLMDRPSNVPLTRDVARDVCVRTGGTAIVTGSIASLGNQYVLGLRAELCGTGDLLDQEQLQAARKEDVLNVLSQLATRFRTRVGESLTTVQKHSTPLEEATTPSLDALKAYSAVLVSHPGTMVALLKRAVQIDPNFAMAHAMLALAYSARGETVLGEESVSRAYDLRDHANDRERFFIATIYDRQVTGNLEREAETMRLWAQTYPRDVSAVGLLGGFASAGTGNYELQIQSGRQVIALDPAPAGVIAASLSMARGYLSLGRLSDAEQALRQAIGRGPDVPTVLLHTYDLAFLKGDAAGIERVAAQAKGKPDVEDWIAHLQALTAARAGRLEDARRSARHAIGLASAGGKHERAAVWETGMAVWEALYGNAKAAQRSATHVLDIAKGRHVTYAAALALANAGERSRAQAIAEDLDRRYPEDTSVRFAYVPALRALSALNANDPSRALDVLRPAATYEFAQPGICFYGAGGGSFGAMYPTYLRGEAYLALHQGDEAAAEFQKILDHPGVVLMDPIGALARLQLGRAWVQAGHPAKARTAYADLLELWKDADSDIAILQQAKSEYGKLQ